VTTFPAVVVSFPWQFHGKSAEHCSRSAGGCTRLCADWYGDAPFALDQDLGEQSVQCSSAELVIMNYGFPCGGKCFPAVLSGASVFQRSDCWTSRTPQELFREAGVLLGMCTTACACREQYIALARDSRRMAGPVTSIELRVWMARHQHPRIRGCSRLPLFAFRSCVLVKHVRHRRRANACCGRHGGIRVCMKNAFWTCVAGSLCLWLLVLLCFRKQPSCGRKLFCIAFFADVAAVVGGRQLGVWPRPGVLFAGPPESRCLPMVNLQTPRMQRRSPDPYDSWFVLAFSADALVVSHAPWTRKIFGPPANAMPPESGSGHQSQGRFATSSITAPGWSRNPGWARMLSETGRLSAAQASADEHLRSPQHTLRQRLPFPDPTETDRLDCRPDCMIYRIGSELRTSDLLSMFPSCPSCYPVRIVPASGAVQPGSGRVPYGGKFAWSISAFRDLSGIVLNTLLGFAKANQEEMVLFLLYSFEADPPARIRNQRGRRSWTKTLAVYNWNCSSKITRSGTGSRVKYRRKHWKSSP